MMSIRTLVLLAALLPVAGCGEPGAFCPGPGPPIANTETLRRVCGEPVLPLPRVVADSGNVWPRPPAPVPTLLDLQRQPPALHAAPAALQWAAQHRGGHGLCLPGPGRAAPPGVALGLCYVAGGRQ